MGGDGLTREEVRAMAQDIGMTHLTDEHVEALLRATKVALARRASLRVSELTPADEPAHVFRLTRGERT